MKILVPVCVTILAAITALVSEVKKIKRAIYTVSDHARKKVITAINGYTIAER